MALRRLITLREPIDTGIRDQAGRTKVRFENHNVRAERRDRPSAAEGFISSEIVGTTGQRHYIMKEWSVSPKPNVTWGVIDEDGNQLNIEGVFENPNGPQGSARELILVCIQPRAGVSQ